MSIVRCSLTIWSRISTTRSYCSQNVGKRSLEHELPSDFFLKQHVRQPIYRSRLTQIVSEVQLFLDIFGSESLPTLGDDDWLALLRCGSHHERKGLLFELQNAKDWSYPCSSKSSTEVSSVLPKLTIDCSVLKHLKINHQSAFLRQIGQLVSENGSDVQKFDISLTHYLPDNQLAYLAKKFWKFPVESSPTFMPRGIKKEEDTIAITWHGKGDLDVLPLSTKNIVLYTCRDSNKFRSSDSIAKSQGIPTYRLPIEASFIFNGTGRIATFPECAQIFRQYFNKTSLDQAIKDTLSSRQSQKRHLIDKFLLETFDATLEDLNISTEMKKPAKNELKETKPRIHKYSREERRQMRAPN